MSFATNYLTQVELLLNVLSIINKQDCFALKGGTAINLFFQNMPRLSVDIDLAYLPIESRTEFLEKINYEMKVLARNIKEQSKGAYTVNEQLLKNSNQIAKLIVSNRNVNIKIEPNLVLRGTVFDCEVHALCQKAQDQFLQYFKIKTLSFADTYAGKLCAALARQHPRDLFDIKLLLESQGITEQLRQAFVIYLASNPRPIHEILNPNLQDLSQNYYNNPSAPGKVRQIYGRLKSMRAVRQIASWNQPTRPILF